MAVKLNAKSKALLVAIGAAMATAPNYKFVTDAQAKQLAEAEGGSLIMVNGAITEGDKKATVLSAAGQALLPEIKAELEAKASEPAGETTPFKIDTGFTPAPATRGVGARASIYPFHQLVPGQSFFVPASERMPKPEKVLTSSVSTARKKAAKDGKAVSFVVRGVEENGVKGARVYCVANNDPVLGASAAKSA